MYVAPLTYARSNCSCKYVTSWVIRRKLGLWSAVGYNLFWKQTKKSCSSQAFLWALEIKIFGTNQLTVSSIKRMGFISGKKVKQTDKDLSAGWEGGLSPCSFQEWWVWKRLANTVCHPTETAWPKRAAQGLSLSFVNGMSAPRKERSHWDQTGELGALHIFNMVHKWAPVWSRTAGMHQ